MPLFGNDPASSRGITNIPEIQHQHRPSLRHLDRPVTMQGFEGRPAGSFRWRQEPEFSPLSDTADGCSRSCCGGSFLLI